MRRLQWQMAAPHALLEELERRPAGVIFCAVANLGASQLLLVELSRPGEEEHYDQIEAWLDRLDAKIEALGRQGGAR